MYNLLVTRLPICQNRSIPYWSFTPSSRWVVGSNCATGEEGKSNMCIRY